MINGFSAERQLKKEEKPAAAFDAAAAYAVEELLDGWKELADVRPPSRRVRACLLCGQGRRQHASIHAIERGTLTQLGGTFQ